MSREMKHGSADWNEVLSPGGVLIRNYVSDADKLLSLGADGYQRILQYNTEKMGIAPTPSVIRVPTEHTVRSLIAEINRVIECRMVYVPSYIYTVAGRKIAEAKLNELLCAHSEWRNAIEGSLADTSLYETSPP